MTSLAQVRIRKVYCEIDILKQYKIRYKSGGNKTMKAFGCIYVCVGCFLISYVLHKRITASGNLPPQRREVVVRVDENCFYRAIALWRDEMSDEKHEEIHKLSSCLIEKNPMVFEPVIFSTNSVRVQSLYM